MNRAAYLAPLLLLGVSMCVAAGDKDIIRSAIHSAIEPKSRDQGPNDSSNDRRDSGGSSDSAPLAIANQVVSNGRHRGSYHDRDYDCLDLIDCPIGAPGTPGYAEVRERFRHLTDTDLWNICSAERTAAYGYVHDVACALIASPDPWRPVETPHDVESGPPLPTDEYDLLAEVANARVGPAGAIFDTANIDAALDDSALPPCRKDAKGNDTLNRKRPKLDCKPPEAAE